jgi:hypothetical protein
MGINKKYSAQLSASNQLNFEKIVKFLNNNRDLLSKRETLPDKDRIIQLFVPGIGKLYLTSISIDNDGRISVGATEVRIEQRILTNVRKQFSAKPIHHAGDNFCDDWENAQNTYRDVPKEYKEEDVKDGD